MRKARLLMRMPAFLLGLVLAPGLCLAGSVTGKVVLAGPVPPSNKIEVTIDQYVCGKEKDAEDLQLSPRKEIRNAVVWIENPPAGAPWPGRDAKIEVDQKACDFIPHVVLVPAGGTVDFLNSDRLLHNIHAKPKLNVSFNRTQPKSRTIPVTFAKPEIVHINCDLHSWMSNWVVVMAHPFYAITGADGQFTFNNLPAGRYTLHVWQERLGEVRRTVTVSEGANAPVTIQMKAP
jgi:plastocyanin